MPKTEEQIPAPPTLAQLRAHTSWLWLGCRNRRCLHDQPVLLDPIIEKLGASTSSDVLRARARCSKCGSLGASTMLPSWKGSDAGWAPFPNAIL